MDTVYGKPNPSSGLPVEIYDLTGTGGGTYAEAAAIIGWDGTNLVWRRVAVDTKGQLIISNPGSGGSGGGGGVIQVIGTDGSATNVGSAAGNLSVPVSGAFTISTATVVQGTASNLNVTAVEAGTWSVTVNNGTVTSIPSGTQSVTGTVAVTQVTSPWVVSGTTTAIPSGTTTVVGTVTDVPSGTQSVAGTVSTVPTGTTIVTGTVTDIQSTSPWIVGGTTTTVPSGTQTIAGTVVTSGTGIVVGVEGIQVWGPGALGTWTNVGYGTTGTVVNLNVPVAIESGTAAVTQVTSPWVIGGTTTNVPSGTQSVAQTGSPWGVSGTVTAVESGTWSVSVVGTATTAPTGTQTVVVTGTVTDSIAGGTVTAVPSGTTTVAGTVTAISSGSTSLSFPEILDYAIQTAVYVRDNEALDRLDTIASLLENPPIIDHGPTDVRKIGIVGPRTIADGNYAWDRHDRTGALVTTPGHCQYQEASLRGNIFGGANNAYITPSNGGTAVVGLILYNPPNSNKNLTVLEATINFTPANGTTTNLGFSSYSWFVAPSPTTLPTGTTTMTTFNALIGSPASTVAFVYSTATFSNAPLVYKYLALIAHPTSAGLQNLTIYERPEGKIIVQPGYYVAVQANGQSGTQGFMSGNIIWEELSI